tara:strand:- start:350 stop:598 length:249 start_codon:yes stop_codon:yes gene_type:complete
MAPVSSKTFVSRLKKLFKECTIELTHVNEDKETLLVNGEIIDLMWMPNVKTIADKETVSILYSDCKKSIRKLLKKQNKKEEK